MTYFHNAVAGSDPDTSVLKIGLALLAVPITASTGLWLLTGARRWCHIAAFSLGSVLFGVSEAYLVAYHGVFDRD
ncbi:MAG: hypothetical protein WCB12_18155 [Bryobacteraceae bacterium]